MQECVRVCVLEVHFGIESSSPDEVGSFVGDGVQEMYLRTVELVCQVDGGVVVVEDGGELKEFCCAMLPYSPYVVEITV